MCVSVYFSRHAWVQFSTLYKRHSQEVVHSGHFVDKKVLQGQTSKHFVAKN